MLVEFIFLAGLERVGGGEFSTVKFSPFQQSDEFIFLTHVSKKINF